MAEVIQDLFLNPPFAVARLGGGSVPQDSYRWETTPDPRSNGETVAAPDWSLTVEADATVTPHLPASLRFRDGAMIRPVAPFVEVWALVGEPGSAPSTWREVSLTPDRLTAEDIALSALQFSVTAMNGKAARRTGNPALRFGTFAPVDVGADDHGAKLLLATSPPNAQPKMIPEGRSIPLGSVQVLRSRSQPAPGSTPWADAVDVAVIRLRFTPAQGHFYGPPNTATPQPTTRRGNRFAPVDAARAFLDPSAGWAGAIAVTKAPDAPSDTYDGASVGNQASLGVVDDTCEARIEVRLPLPQGGHTLTAAASIFVAPPDFAPDRRPFVSLADEINDRAGDTAARSSAMSAPERDAWVENLFERIYETMSLFNVDCWRAERAATLTGAQLKPEPIANDTTPDATHAAGGRDALRNPMYALLAPSNDVPLPMTQHARSRHRYLSDLQALVAFILKNPGRLRALIRGPFEIRANETADVTTMAMPPFMRQSNALPLSLSAWQYQLLMDWVSQTETGTGAIPQAVAQAAAAAPRPAGSPLSARAQRRRDQVLARVRRVQP
ncbi:hypothetical protein [Paraburkholderia nodosa]|uniref:hypothetical protein n=1 Tax=Paraburkholderia nodosa TaxID=392320 RepID=UPI0008422215|nr:hypothetical protein [Paraburkholderia nodosa]